MGPGRASPFTPDWRAVAIANRYAIAPGVVQLASGAQVEVMPGALFSSSGAVFTAAGALFTTAMTLGSSGTAVANPNPVAQSVTVSGGTVSGISISGVSTGQTSGTFTVPVGGTIAVTYSVAPTFTVADIAPGSTQYPFVSGVLAGYLAAYPNGPQVS
jgi:hypothetical protein